MPHLELRLSRNLVDRIDLPAVVSGLSDELLSCGIFPLGGIRVRAIICDFYAIADRHPENAFVDIQLRVGAGRSPDQLKQAGERLFASARAQFADELAKPHFMLSFDIQVIDPQFSWKENSIHERLKAQGDNKP